MTSSGTNVERAESSRAEKHDGFNLADVGPERYFSNIGRTVPSATTKTIPQLAPPAPVVDLQVIEQRRLGQLRRDLQRRFKRRLLQRQIPKRLREVDFDRLAKASSESTSFRRRCGSE